MHRKASAQTQEIMPGHTGLAPPRNLHFKIHLGRGECAPRVGPRVGQCGKRNQVTGLKEDKDQEEVAPSLGVPAHTLSLLCFSLNKPFLCVLYHLFS